MNTEQRIDDLERRLRELQEAFELYLSDHRADNGLNYGMSATLMTLLQTHHQPEVLLAQLQNNLARTEAMTVGSSTSDADLVGFQRAQGHFLSVAQESARREAEGNAGEPPASDPS